MRPSHSKSATPYVLITAARNEEEYIERTLESVESQTVLPVKWVIVSDGSTDRTDEIVARHAENCDFIELVHRNPAEERNFGAKVYAVQLGIEALAGIDYDFIGILDADVSFESCYYERALARFEREPKLGIVGGVRFDDCGGTYRRVMTAKNSAGGPTQFFRRICYESFGGYLPLPKGGVDAFAEIRARMNGWTVRTVSELQLRHHRRTGTEKRNILSARYRQGIMDYSLGYHPLFEAARCVYRIIERPYFVGSCCRLAGYCRAALRRDSRAVSPEVVAFLRREQLKRLGLGRSTGMTGKNT